MGWTYFHRDTNVSVRDTLASECANPAWRIIDSAVVNRSEFYAAIEYVQDGAMPKGTVAALVFLVKFASRSEYNFGYKDMDETCLPYSFNCPKRILDKLTPTTNKNALAWRAACRERIERRKPKAGETVRFTSPITFSNGTTLDTFRYVKGSRFYPLDNRTLYRITGWKDREYTIIG